MKNWLAIFLAFLFAFAAIFPAAAQTPTPTSTPTPPTAMTVHIEIGGSITYSNSGEFSGDLKCTTLEGGYYDLTSVGATATFTTQAFTCLGQLVMGIDSSYGGTNWSGGTIGASISDTNNFYYNSDLQTDGIFPEMQSGQTNGIGEATSVLLGGGSFNSYGPLHPGAPEATAVTNYFFVHASTKPACDQGLQKGNIVASGTIDATNEAGVLETLTANHQYELTISGGPWNDGTTDRYDTAMKLYDSGNESSSTWTALADFSQNDLAFGCTQADPLDATKTIMVFTAMETNPAYTTVDWRIRVNDLPGEFGNNTGGMNFELAEISNASYGCQNQYLRGTMVTSGTIPSNNPNGVHVDLGMPTGMAGPSQFIVGTWIEIITSGGPWFDGGSSTPRYDIAMLHPGSSRYWEALSGATYTGCSVTTGDYIDAWVQLPNNNGIDLNVNDTGGNYSDNTGSINYAIYASTNSPIPPSGCSQNFQMGTLIKSVTVGGSLQNGMQVGSLFTGLDVTAHGGESVSTAYIAVETSNAWYSGEIPYTNGAIASSTSAPAASAWQDLSTATGVACAVKIDPIGHYLVFIAVSTLTNNYWIRAQDNIDQNWSNNSGQLTFSFYNVINLTVPGYIPGQGPPGPAACDSYYVKGTVTSTGTIYATNQSGVLLSTLTSGKTYAIETTNGPWSNNGTSSYDVAISEDGGLTWSNLVNYPHLLCAEDTGSGATGGEHYLVYFQALAGRVYKLRVYDPEGNFSDNTGSMGYNFYGNVTIVGLGTDCSASYQLTRITTANSIIPTNNTGGVAIPEIDVADGSTYAIEIASSPSWYYVTQLTDVRYDAQISMDNGATWYDFGPVWSSALCAMQINQSLTDEGKIYRIYFTAPAGQIVKMRVNQQNQLEQAQGNLSFILYGTKATNNTTQSTGIYAGQTTPPAWDLACYESYLRPNGFFENTNFQIPSISFGTLGSITFPSFVVPIPAIDQWISYLEWSVRSYFAWCPEDTAALSAIPTTIEGYEPFGTINDTVAIFRTLANNVTALQSSGGEGQNFAPYSIAFGAGGGQGSSGWQGILPVLGVDSPWLGGKLKWGSGGDTGGAGGGESTITALPSVPSAPGISDTSQAYDTYCQTVMSPHLGASTSTGLCGALALAKTAPLIWVLIQLLSDVGSILIFIQYVQRKWIDAGASG